LFRFGLHAQKIKTINSANNDTVIDARRLMSMMAFTGVPSGATRACEP